MATWSAPRDDRRSVPYTISMARSTSDAREEDETCALAPDLSAEHIGIENRSHAKRRSRGLYSPSAPVASTAPSVFDRLSPIKPDSL